MWLFAIQDHNSGEPKVDSFADSTPARHRFEEFRATRSIEAGASLRGYRDDTGDPPKRSHIPAPLSRAPTSSMSFFLSSTARGFNASTTSAGTSACIRWI